jgi:phage-related protein
MTKLKFDFIVREDGSSEFQDFLNELPEKDRYKLLMTMKKIEEKGITEAIKAKWVKKFKGEKNLFEIRSILGSNIQRAIYFHIENDKYMITHGFTKKTQKTPEREILKGKRVRDLFLKRRSKDEQN